MEARLTMGPSRDKLYSLHTACKCFREPCRSPGPQQATTATLEDGLCNNERQSV